MVNLYVEVFGCGQIWIGFGDIMLLLGIGWYFSFNLYVIGVFDFFVLMGGYNRNDFVNIGCNYWVFGFVYVVSWVDFCGLNVDVKFGYLFN